MVFVYIHDTPLFRQCDVTDNGGGFSHIKSCLIFQIHRFMLIGKYRVISKCIHNMAPSNLQRLFENISRKHNYLLRKSDISLEMPKPRTEAMKRSFQYRGALLWNMLPINICKIDDLQTFKKCIKEPYSEKGITIL